MEKMNDIKLNCTACGSDKFRIVGNATEVPIVLSEPVKYRNVIKYAVRCVDCDGYIGSLMMDDE